MIVVRGATLAGMAAAARLSRLGHEVTLVTDGAPLGQRWASRQGPDSHLVDDMAPVVHLPAAWRDLFKKSGAHLVTELNAAGLTLTPAPATRHLLPDGALLTLPTDRGGQYKAVERLYGASAAIRWRDLLDDLDGLWLAWRAHVLEDSLPLHTASARQALWADRTVSDLADRLESPMSALVLQLAEGPHAPALKALRMVVRRTFGRWKVVDADGVPQRGSVLVDLLAHRLRTCGVTVTDAGEGTDLDARPHRPPRRLFHRRPLPQRAPRVSHHLEATLVSDLEELVDHTSGRPVITWRRPVPGGTLVTTHDHRDPVPTLDHGLAALTWREWTKRPPVVDGDLIRASACSPAGPEPWAELGSAALATYALHQRLTGEDARPTNKDFRPPRPRR